MESHVYVKSIIIQCEKYAGRDQRKKILITLKSVKVPMEVWSKIGRINKSLKITGQEYPSKEITLSLKELIRQLPELLMFFSTF